MPDPLDPVPGRVDTGLGPIGGETTIDPVVTPTVAPGTVTRPAAAPVDDPALRLETSVEQATGGAGPSNWWRYGVLLLAIIVVAIGLMQWMAGNNGGTAVAPGTPVSAPQTTGPVTTTPAPDAPQPASGTPAA